MNGKCRKLLSFPHRSYWFHSVAFNVFAELMKGRSLKNSYLIMSFPWLSPLNDLYCLQDKDQIPYGIWGHPRSGTCLSIYFLFLQLSSSWKHLPPPRIAALIHGSNLCPSSLPRFLILPYLAALKIYYLLDHGQSHNVFSCFSMHRCVLTFLMTQYLS